MVDSLGDLRHALAGYPARRPQAANRMNDLQALVQAELRRRFTAAGRLLEVRLGEVLRGKHGTKNWDVLLTFAQRPHLAVSTKAIMKNAGGTVPNRIDDAMGECVNVHAHYPGMVLGYLFVMDAVGANSGPLERRWGDVLAESLLSFSGRRSASDANELFEAATLLIVDFAPELPTLQFHPRLLDWTAFFDVLVGHVRARNPVIDQAMRPA